MNPLILENHIGKVLSSFSNQIKKIDNKNNEIYIHLKDVSDTQIICNNVYENLNTKLATIICTDEQKNGNGFVIRYVFEKLDADIFIFIITSLGKSNCFPSIVSHVPAAASYEREIKDMFGLVPVGNPDLRPLVLHEHWPNDMFPLRKEFDLMTKAIRQEQEYAFLRVEGDGICEIPVGPVHAGIIEPGHFRFSVLGENIINLETRLFYTHKGIEKLAESMKLDEALLLSERISGDESVANSTAYCQAIEKISQISIPNNAKKIRTIFGELERAYNHIGTLGGISTDAGFAFGAARLNILKERLMQLNESLSGSRLLFGVNRIGGVKCGISESKKKLIRERIDEVLSDFDKIIGMLKSKSSFMDRLKDTGIIQKKIAHDLGIVGIAARCIGIDVDTRYDHPYANYVVHNHRTPQQVMQSQIEMEKRSGDVLARFEVRINEVHDSFKIIRESLDLADDSLFTDVPVEITPYGSALGYAESHRGQTLHWIMMGEKNSIFRYKIRTASFCNWKIMEHAVLNDIVPDFPLVNKSLDLSYSGNDL
ncbi:hydrogenase large subunit [Candidatus Nitrosotalea okcheonensis]|uniref:Membrane-bound [NiFe]-hydrogenase-3, large subunit (Chain E)-like protein n=1 Tax=Candidatus Nitrosotalea okcheonensis TaxID=1903276 RepID=A0A2H1FDW4_9ARCH|nr:NADH-quinone oxidoreductase subunit C [Candidatus Nitrosotalea okcheonensis]SMH70954.1 Membrane-bound [NiFe]-hydrogenase-3, large subunit (Chain E)-like protein [Candidatus Nitrosotalea okcheonensis]